MIKLNKMHIRFLCLITALLMFALVSCKPNSGTTDTERTTIDTTGENPTSEIVTESICDTAPQPDPVEEDVFDGKTISTVKDLLAFADTVNKDWKSYYGKTVVLTEDLDLSELESDWVPIGWKEQQELDAFLADTLNYPVAFSGTFDGQGHKITGIKFRSENEFAFGGFFGLLFGATVKNLGVEGTMLYNGRLFCMGLMAGGAVRTTFENCYVKGSLTGSLMYEGDCSWLDTNGIGGFIGGVAGKDCTELRNCYASVNMEHATNYSAGGLVGAVYGEAQLHLTGCYMYAKDLSSYYLTANGDPGIGCLVGYTDRRSSTKIQKCYAATDATTFISLLAPMNSLGNVLSENSYAISAKALRNASKQLGDAYKASSKGEFPILDWESEG